MGYATLRWVMYRLLRLFFGLTVTGTYGVWPLGTRVPHPGTIAVAFGSPITPEAASTRKGERSLTTRIMEAIASLARQSATRDGAGAGSGPDERTSTGEAAG